MCNVDCNQLTDGTSRHRVVLCSDRRNHPAQYPIQDAMVKGVIPHGLIDRLWKDHIYLDLLEVRAKAIERLRAGNSAKGAG